MSERTEQVETRYVIVYADQWECDYATEADARDAFARDLKWAAKDGSEHPPVRIERRTTRTITERETLEGAA